MQDIKVKGQVDSIKDSRYGYWYIRIRVNYNEFYSVHIQFKKINKFGFIPKKGMWIYVEGKVFPKKDEMYDPSIKYVKVFKHIKKPE